MNCEAIGSHIQEWLSAYCAEARMDGFIVGISGGIDSALTSTLCAMTGKPTLIVTMPIRQTSAEYERAIEHIDDLKKRFPNVSGMEVNLTSIFEQMEKDFPTDVVLNQLAMANTRARMRMTTLYALGQTHKRLVAGTGNRVEDFGVGFYTKYGDGGVDLSPIADLTKTEVRAVAAHLGIVESIIVAKPTDGLWADGRSDEDQLGASYPELEWAMDYTGNETELNERQLTVLALYRRLHAVNKHKMEPIPVCLIPGEWKVN